MQCFIVFNDNLAVHHMEKKKTCNMAKYNKYVNVMKTQAIKEASILVQ
jgi:hypothetical protein